MVGGSVVVVGVSVGRDRRVPVSSTPEVTASVTTMDVLITQDSYVEVCDCNR